MRRSLRSVLASLDVITFVALVASLGSAAAASGCSKGGGDGPTAPANYCGEAGFDSRANIGFNLGCNSVTTAVSGITYDNFSRVTSYNYDFSCTGGSNRKTGRVYNITYNNLGVALTWDFTVNGSTCHKS